MGQEGNEPVTVEDVMLLCETKKAYGITTDIAPYKTDAEARAKGPKPVEFWIPKSQVDDSTLTAIGSVGMLVMPRWLADKNDLYYSEI